MTFPQLRQLYFAHKGRGRTPLIDRFWQYLEVDSLRAFDKYVRRLSALSIKADFCLALDAYLRDLSLDFESLFARELRLDLESVQPLKHHLKKIMGKAALRRSFPDDHNVSHTRLIYDLNHSVVGVGFLMGGAESVEKQISEITRRETENFLVGEYGQVVYDDWLSHFVYGESLRSLALVRGVSHEAVRLRIRKARRGLAKFLRKG